MTLLTVRKLEAANDGSFQGGWLTVLYRLAMRGKSRCRVIMCASTIKFAGTSMLLPLFVKLFLKIVWYEGLESSVQPCYKLLLPVNSYQECVGGHALQEESSV